MPNLSHFHQATKTLSLLPIFILAVACSESDPAMAASAQTSTAPEMTPLEQAADECTKRRPVAKSYIYATDQGQTLIVDHQGDEDEVGVGATTDELVCVLEALEAPEAIIARMSNTRALDGVQEGDWGDYAAVWSYHPDDGFDLIVEQAQ